MARVTVEDCIDKVDNRFDLVLLALSLVDTHGTDGVSKLLEHPPNLYYCV